MDVESVFVTGANRGIGLEYVRQLSSLSVPPKFIFATYRNKDTSQALRKLKEESKQCKIILIQLDVRNVEDLKNARKIVEENVGENGLTLLINNAGVAKPVPFPEVTEENMLLHFTNNTVAPVLVVKELLPLLQKAASRKGDSSMGVSRAAALNISSMAGSIMDVVSKPPSWLAAFSYGISKAALNMAMRIVAAQLKDQGILVVQMCPGWVRTDMGTEQGEITVEESISAMLSTLPRLDDTHQGSYLDRNGKPISF